MFDQVPKSRNQRIQVVSLDMDECLFNRSYKWLPKCSTSEVIDKNKELLDFIKSKALHYNEFIIFLGSARQTKKIDMHCSAKNKTESAFMAIKNVTTYLDAKLDDFLLADIYYNLDAGASMQRANDEIYRGEHSTGPNDHTKFTLLYAQTHKIANHYPNHEITFDFYDDGGKIRAKILHDLLKYFSDMPDKLPHNVVLNLIHYEGGETSLIGSIRGSGFIDINYRRTVYEITMISRQYIAVNYEAITNNTLRLDERGFLYRKPLKPAIDEGHIRALVHRSTTAPTPMLILSLPVIMTGLILSIWAFIFNFSALTVDQVNELDKPLPSM